MRWGIILSIFLASIWAGPQPEYRALWVTRFELTSTQNLPVIVQKAADNNFNAIFVQVCGRGTAFYDSKILPRDSRAVSFDALSILIGEAKKRNIEIHAWVNALYVWSDKSLPESSEHVVNKHPEWLSRNVKDKQDNNYYLDPAQPEVRDYVRSVYHELVVKYDLAGVHLDYIRYPGKSYGYSERTRQVFEHKYSIDPKALAVNQNIVAKLYGSDTVTQLQTKWDDFRRNAVSELVSDIYKDILRTNPDLKMSAAVIADYQAATSNYFQDWTAWLEKGQIDLVMPMAYSTDEKEVESQIAYAAQVAQRYDRQVIIGLGSWRRSPESIAKSVEFSRQVRAQLKYQGLVGIVLFSYDRMAQEKEYFAKVKKLLFAEKTDVPGLPYQKRQFADQEMIPTACPVELPGNLG